MTETHARDTAPSLVDARRRAWAQRREAIAAVGRPSSPDGLGRKRISLTDIAAPILRLGLSAAGLRRRAETNALAVGLTTIRIPLPALPPAFEGYRILQISDPHLDIHAALAGRLEAATTEVEADIVLYTGDYSTRSQRQFPRGLDALAPLVRKLHGQDGSFALLGNHDETATATHLEAMGLTVLLNEHVTISRGSDRLILTGLDDVHFYFSEDARAALSSAGTGFRIAAVHSPEAADLAAAAGYDLYLCGHTHGGQICLPGGRPLLSATTRCHEFVSGIWRCGDMRGFTSRGVGCSGLPARFNCPPEACLIVLTAA